MVICSADKLRAARKDDASPRLLSVFATPLPELNSHADVCVHVTPTKLDKEYLKFYLWESFRGKDFVSQLLASGAFS